MAVELKVIFEKLGNVKKQIEDGFKGGINIQQKTISDYKGGQISKDAINYQVKLVKQYKQNIDALEKYKRSLGFFERFSKASQINTKIMKEQSRIIDINNKLEKATGGFGIDPKLIEGAGIKREKVEDSKQKTGKGGGGKMGGMIGLAAIAGGVIGLLSQLIQSTKAIQFTMELIGGLLNALLAPILLVVLTLLKPFLIMFLLLSKFLFDFFMDPGKALQGLWDSIKTGLANLFGFNGKDKQKDAIETSNSLIGAGVGAVLGGPIGAVIGAIMGGLVTAVSEWLGVEEFGGILTAAAGIVLLTSKIGLLSTASSKFSWGKIVKTAGILGAIASIIYLTKKYDEFADSSDYAREKTNKLSEAWSNMFSMFSTKDEILKSTNEEIGNLAITGVYVGAVLQNTFATLGVIFNALVTIVAAGIDVILAALNIGFSPLKSFIDVIYSAAEGASEVFGKEIPDSVKNAKEALDGITDKLSIEETLKRIENTFAKGSQRQKKFTDSMISPSKAVDEYLTNIAIDQKKREQAEKRNREQQAFIDKLITPIGTGMMTPIPIGTSSTTTTNNENNFNITVNGNADRNTIEMIKKELRRELSAKGSF